MAATIGSQCLSGVLGTTLAMRTGGWTTPRLGWFKFNSDGSRLFGNGITTYGVFRNNFGDWIVGYSKMLGACSAIEVELCLILEGLQQAWCMGCDVFVLNLIV
ncbi:hypothetical protein V6N13_075138 [Hibiscus sabdariffa]